jgi:NAD-dependent deacetylase
LIVYPAAGLIDYAPRGAKVFLIDPNNVDARTLRDVTFIKQPASTGVPKMISILKEIVQ